MTIKTRKARPEDLESIAPWTTDTFDWGDYIPERFLNWLEDVSGEVIVCVDDHDVPVALAHARMVSPTEGWLEGARVHPDHQRRGLGIAMNDAGVAWAKERGARVVRLAIEADNVAANSQVEKLGYRLGSKWVAGFLEPEVGYRSPTSDSLTPSNSSDVDAAWVSWSMSDLATSGRSLLCEGWEWRMATVDDLRQAAATGRMLQSRHGWAIQREIADEFDTNWLATTKPGLPGLLNGLIDRAAASGHDRMVVRLPHVDWVRESLHRAGFVTSEIYVYYLAA